MCSFLHYTIIVVICNTWQELLLCALGNAILHTSEVSEGLELVLWTATLTLCAHVDLSLGRLPGRDWKRRPGRPNNRWVHQIRNDTGNIPSTLWRSAILRGHGTGVTQRPSPATRTWWWWWWVDDDADDGDDDDDDDDADDELMMSWWWWWWWWH